MNKLMMMLHCGSMPRYMAEAGGAGGGGEGGSGGAAGAGGEGAAGGEGKPGEGAAGGEGKPGEGKPGEGGEGGEGKPGTIQSAIAKKVGEGGEGKPGEGKPGEGGEGKPGEGGEGKPKEFTDDDFEKGIVTSEAVKKAAGVEGMELSSEIIKGMLPTIRKVGLNPEQANELANELAMQQIAVAKAQAEARAADIKQMNEEAMKIYPDKQSWDAIGDGVKFAFKPDGVMYNTILSSELGSDPEFLALMKWVGERVAKDRLAGAPGSGGEKPVSYEKALMG